MDHGDDDVVDDDDEDRCLDLQYPINGGDKFPLLLQISSGVEV
jgi:hypothetical protein